MIKTFSRFFVSIIAIVLLFGSFDAHAQSDADLDTILQNSNANIVVLEGEVEAIKQQLSEENNDLQVIRKQIQEAKKNEDTKEVNSLRDKKGSVKFKIEVSQENLVFKYLDVTSSLQSDVAFGTQKLESVVSDEQSAQTPLPELKTQMTSIQDNLMPKLQTYLNKATRNLETQEVAKAYEAQCTPDIYVFDADHKLAYHGRVDDNWKEPENVSKEELAEALDALVKGEKPNAEQHPAMGCSIKWK